MKEYILCADTSAKTGSLALFKESSSELILINKTRWEKEKSHSEVITEKFSELLNSANIQVSDIKTLVVTHGPGSFTGIRVGLNFIKALAYSLKVPVYTYNSLITLAYSECKSKKPILVINNAHKNMLYTAVYSTSPFSEIENPQALKIKDVETLLKDEIYLCLGDGFTTYQKVLPSSLTDKLSLKNSSTLLNLSQTLGELWFFNKKTARPLNWNQVLPLYIRSSEAEERLWGGLSKP